MEVVRTAHLKELGLKETERAELNHGPYELGSTLLPRGFLQGLYWILIEGLLGLI